MESKLGKMDVPDVPKLELGSPNHLTYLFLKNGPTLLFAISIIAFNLINIKF